MDLFEQGSWHINRLPYDGTVLYFGPVISIQQANIYLEKLFDSIDWKHDEAIIYGKHITTKRKVAWYGDKPFSYTYSRITKHALSWNAVLLELKQIVENHTGEKFNSCLLNLYHDGNEGMAWHSDEEIDLRKNGTIASLSFGAKRKFSFKHKISKEKCNVLLESGSLLVMKDTTQAFWQHRLPPSKHITAMRINLTFRQINDLNI